MNKENAFMVHWAKQNQGFFNPLDDNDAAEQVGYYYGYNARDNEVAELKEGLQKIIDIYNHSEPCRNAFIANDLVIIARKALEKSDE